jgi:uncharacterized membrane protein YcaP (DUF421 family)
VDFDWRDLFVLDTPFLELVVRGTVVYFALLLAMRVLVRRHVSSLNLMDLLLVVLIADAAQNAMADEYRSITGGLVLCGTLFAWNFLFDWLAFYSEIVARILEPAPLALIRNGRFQRRNLRREFITEDEILSKLREQQIEDVRTVRLAYLEPDGELSVKQDNGEKSPQRPKHKSTPGAGR